MEVWSGISSCPLLSPSRSSSRGLVQAQSIREAGTRAPLQSVQMVQSAARAPSRAPRRDHAGQEGRQPGLREMLHPGEVTYTDAGSTWSSEDPLCCPKPPGSPSAVLTWRPALAGIGPDRNAVRPGIPRSLAWRESEQRLSGRAHPQPPTPTRARTPCPPQGFSDPQPQASFLGIPLRKRQTACIFAGFPPFPADSSKVPQTTLGEFIPPPWKEGARLIHPAPGGESWHMGAAHVP